MRSRFGFLQSLSAWLADNQLLPVSSPGFSVLEHPWGFFCVLIIFSYKDTSQIGLGPTLMAHFDLITYLKALTPITITF